MPWRRRSIAAMAYKGGTGMKACLSFFKMRFKYSLQYRTAAWAGVSTQFFWGFMEIQLYRAFYADHGDAFPMSLGGLVSYIWLRQALLALLNTWTIEPELFDMVLTGNVAYELCRPVNLYGMWFSRTVATRLSKACLRCWPILMVAALLPEPWGLCPPAGLLALGMFIISLGLSVCVTSAFLMIMYFSCFFTISSDGPRAIVMPIVDLLSGGVIPLPFMPGWLSTVLRYSPFGAMANAPLRIYSGDIAGSMLWETLGLQVFWLGILVAIGYGLQRRGLNRLCVQGG